MHTMLEDYGVIIDEFLIDEFREQINENLDYSYNHFSNKEGKDQWGALCSCMDWITVSVRYIKRYPELSDDIDVKAMQIYSLISAIDIISESVEQLHRIVISQKLKEWPFKGRNSIFKEKVPHLSSRDDDHYFKEIRSIFGAHPTKLKNGDKEKLFASWPHEHSMSGFDFTVSISSNIVGKDDFSFGIHIIELLNYAKEKFEHLLFLIKGLDKLYKSCCAELAKVMIPETDNIQDELVVLLDASIARYDNDHYRYTLNELTKLFGVGVQEDHLKGAEQELKDKLLPLVAEIRHNLQTMNLVDFKHSDVLVSSLPERALSYELPKLFSILHSDHYDPLVNFYFKRLNEYCGEEYAFDVRNGDDVTLLKLRMMTYAARERTKTAVNLVEAESAHLKQ